MPTAPLSGRIAAVTGASAGIGAAIARQLVSLGAKVVINARREAPLAVLREGLGHGNVAICTGDAADAAVVTRILDTAREAFGQGTRDADLVVVNAGRGLNGSVMSSDTAQWEDMIRTNLLGAALLIREAGLRMLKTTEGKTGPAVVTTARDIVVLGSTVGRNVSPFSSMYGSTKFGVHGLVEGARRELGPKGIRVSVIAPGFVKSEFQDVAGYDPKWVDGVFEKIGPVLGPDDIARTVAFIVSQPPAVHVNDVMIRSTRQDYP